MASSPRTSSTPEAPSPVVDEESPLLGRPESPLHEVATRSKLLIYATFLGVFVASADESLVISTYGTIASQFQQLARGSWLLVSYNFGFCVSLPVYGTLSDSFGRKNVLLASYAAFMTGCLFCGASTSITQLAISRAISGIGGGGMMTVVSIIITGRSIGAPIGGILADTIGWKLSFFGQVPFVVLSALIVIIWLPASTERTRETVEIDQTTGGSSRRARLSDIDYAGIVLLSSTVLLLLFLLQVIGSREPHPSTVVYLSAAFLLSGVLLVLFETYGTIKPLIPMALLKQALGAHCLVQVVLNAGRFALVSNIMPYFIRVDNASSFEASLAYLPMAIGTSIGGIVSGLVIKRTGRTKPMILISLLVTLAGLTALLLAWRSSSSPWKRVYLIPLGAAPGLIFPCLFASMTSLCPEDALSICIGIFYLSQQLGFIVGPAAGTALVQGFFSKSLWRELGDVAHKKLIIQRVLNDISFAATLPPSLQTVVKSCYLRSFQSAPIFAIVMTALTLPILLLMRDNGLKFAPK
ncbi:hypothetical protein FE257_000933 [Aspergillus nanangensis]|uniref:Major facilitator superfamily (MFS) profile domain-containing protein n=1 Tax=Aspergillus nanangensis TaxID=2582783 RepID=A0AAD4CE79_ASPNN|nr:hypothetical protein FE257_000933 [Aspergillus nanangensis]